MDQIDDIASVLRRWPDLEGQGLAATDSADELLIAEAASAVARADQIAVVGDAYGGITARLLQANPARSIRVYSDSVLGERAILANCERLGLDNLRLTFGGLSPQLFEGVDLVLCRLPRGVEALREIAENIAQGALRDVTVLAAGRDKHMSRGMNEVLSEYFTEVTASLGWRKSRVLRARTVLADTPEARYPQTFQVREPDLGLDLEMVAHAGAFASGRLDLGARALLRHRDAMSPTVRHAVDLGCGTGIVGIALASHRPSLALEAIDVSWAAVESTRASVAMNGLEPRIRASRADGLQEVATGSVDLVVCNPPMHSGAAVVPQVGTRMLRGAGRVLRPGGELWTVFNSRLSRARELRTLVGPTEVIEDDGSFTVTRTRPRHR